MEEHRAGVKETGRVRRRRAEIEELVERYRLSGQTQSAYAAAEGLKVGTLRQWLYRREGKETGSGGMVPVKVVEGRGTGRTVVIRYTSGVEVEFAGGVEVGVLRELIELGDGGRC